MIVAVFLRLCPIRTLPPSGARFVRVICARGLRPRSGGAPARIMRETDPIFPRKKFRLRVNNPPRPAVRPPNPWVREGAGYLGTRYHRSDPGKPAAFEHTITPVLQRFPCLPVL